MEAQADAMFGELRSIVGDLSDLRYGRLQKSPDNSRTTVNEALDGMQRLEDICNGGIQA